MKTIRSSALLVLLLCAVGLAETSEQSKEPSGCAVAKRLAGYSLDIEFPNASMRIKVYDVDYAETQKHDPICLSKKAGDRLFWVSGSGKKFKLKIYPQQDPGTCGRHPFQEEPPSDSVYGHLSGPLKPDVPDNCTYNVEFPKEGEKPSDPHIRVIP